MPTCCGLRFWQNPVTTPKAFFSVLGGAEIRQCDSGVALDLHLLGAILIVLLGPSKELWYPLSSGIS